MKKLMWVLSACGLMLAVACGSDDDTAIDDSSKQFTVTVQNTSPEFKNFSSGAFLTEPLAPGAEKIISFDAGKDHYLSFATMFIKSNDLFYAPDTPGVKLYNEAGNALIGDITNLIKLWDAGTEVNQMPGTGDNQPMNNPNARNPENRNVGLEDDAFSYVPVDSVLRIVLSHDGTFGFTMRIKNISDQASFQTPLSPGAYVIHTKNQRPIFEPGKPASADLTAVAEEGTATGMVASLAESSGINIPFAPGAFLVADSNTMFKIGAKADANLEKLAEDGDPSGYSNVFNTPQGASSPGPIGSNGIYTFSFKATPGQTLSMATMLIQTNDYVYALDGLPLFNGEVPVSGDISTQVKILDVGTEQNETIGIGANQPPRQSGPNTGMTESVNIRTVTNNDIRNIKVTIAAE